MSRQATSLAALRNDLSNSLPWLPFCAPFGIFVALTYLQPILPISSTGLYLIKTTAACILLALFWPLLRVEMKLTLDGLAVLAGSIVFLVWIGLEGYYPQIGHSSFDPHLAGWKTPRISMAIRLLGASLIVPVIEEIFWRSFVMRFLVTKRFKSIPLGHFTWYSFVFTAIAFGFEHHRWLPGIIAGVIYGALLCRTRNLFSPIQSHAVTNLLLGIYVIQTQQWSYW